MRRLLVIQRAVLRRILKSCSNDLEKKAYEADGMRRNYLWGSAEPGGARRRTVPFSTRRFGLKGSSDQTIWSPKSPRRWIPSLETQTTH